MLEEPRAHRIGGSLREDATPFLLDLQLLVHSRAICMHFSRVLDARARTRTLLKVRCAWVCVPQRSRNYCNSVLFAALLLAFRFDVELIELLVLVRRVCVRVVNGGTFGEQCPGWCTGRASVLSYLHVLSTELCMGLQLERTSTCRQRLFLVQNIIVDLSIPFLSSWRLSRFLFSIKNIVFRKSRVAFRNFKYSLGVNDK